MIYNMQISQCLRSNLELVIDPSTRPLSLLVLVTGKVHILAMTLHRCTGAQVTISNKSLAQEVRRTGPYIYRYLHIQGVGIHFHSVSQRAAASDLLLPVEASPAVLLQL